MHIQSKKYNEGIFRLNEIMGILRKWLDLKYEFEFIDSTL